MRMMTSGRPLQPGLQSPPPTGSRRSTRIFRLCPATHRLSSGDVRNRDLRPTDDQRDSVSDDRLPLWFPGGSPPPVPSPSGRRGHCSQEAGEEGVPGWLPRGKVTILGLEAAAPNLLRAQPPGFPGWRSLRNRTESIPRLSGPVPWDEEGSPPGGGRIRPGAARSPRTEPAHRSRDRSPTR